VRSDSDPRVVVSAKTASRQRTAARVGPPRGRVREYRWPPAQPGGAGRVWQHFVRALSPLIRRYSTCHRHRRPPTHRRTDL